MTLYLIHKIGDKCGKFEKSIFYAFTNKKKIVDDFIEERNMDLFFVKEEFMEKDEYNSFKDEYLKYELGTRSFETRTPFSIKQLSRIDLIATRYEEETCYISSDKVFKELGKHPISDYDVQIKSFNKDIRNALNKLYYDKIIGFFDSESLYFYDSFADVYPMKKLNLRIDTVGLFIYFYGETLKKKW